MEKRKKILAFAREIGGAAALAPLCQAVLEEGWKLVLLSKDHGLRFFKKRNLECIDFPVFEDVYLNKLCYENIQSLPDLIVTSAASLPALDMTEKYLWRWGKEKRIATVAILDQWHNYSLRFSGPGNKDKLAYLPDYIFVMDQRAKEEMIQEGIPEELIVVTGQPAFDKVIEEHEIICSQGDDIKKELAITKEAKTVTFVAESLRKDFGNSLGYDEQSTLGFLGEALNEIAGRNKTRGIELIIKLHPENKHEEFEWALSEWPFLKKQIIAGDFYPRKVIEVSDLVVGMSSILLVEAILANKAVVSLQIDSLVEPQLIAVRTGAIPFVKDRDKAKHLLELLLCDEGYKKEYSQKQSQWQIKKNGTRNCFNELKSICHSTAIVGKK